MTARRKLSIGVGLKRGGTKFPSEAGYVADVNRQCKELEDILIDVFKQFEDVSEDIMIDALRPTFSKARDIYCPKDSGDLRASGYLEKASFRGKPRVEIGFGRSGKPRYTVYVHEMLNFRHEPPTRAKFLQAAVFEDLNDIYLRLGREYKSFMGA